jgi:hypothetical protein
MHLTSSAQGRLCDQRSGLHGKINTRKRPRVCTPNAHADILRLHHLHQVEWRTSGIKLSGSFAQKKSAGLAPGATFGPVKNLDVLTVDQNPESVLCPSRCSATLSAKEMPLTKHLI